MPFSVSPIVAASEQQIQAQSTLPRTSTAAPPTQQICQAPSLPLHASITVPTRSLQHVLTRGERLKIVKWMMRTSLTEGDKHIPDIAVRNFPASFRGAPNANILKESRLRKNKAEFLNEYGDVQHGHISSITRVTKNGRKCVYSKAKSRRGHKRAAWLEAVHRDLVAEFDRLRKLGVKFNMKIMKSLAPHIIRTTESTEFSSSFIDPKTRKAIPSTISPRWIQSFCERFQIVSRAQTGKLLTSPAKEIFIEKEVAYHLGVLARQFRSKELDENNVENADENHFLINLDNGRTLGFSGESEVKYADVVSWGDGLTMVVRILGGRDAVVEAPFMVFKNASRGYPMRGVPDNVPGFAYRKGPRGWMDTVVMPEWLSERRILGPLPHEGRRILYVDNCSGHNCTASLAAAANNIHTEIRYFPNSATHLIQPCHSFAIQNIKPAWKTRWEHHKMERIMCNDWTDGPGKIKNPGKHSLRLAVNAVRDVNAKRDENGLTYARNPMIRPDMVCSTNGLWEETQLFPNLQAITKKHRKHFNGGPVVENAS